jgi:glucokinase
LYSIYQYLQSIQYAEQLAETKNNIAKHPCKSIAILSNKSDKVVQKSIELFIECLSEFAKTMALVCIPKNGVYLSGTLLMEIEPEIRERFIKGFCDNRKMGSLLKEIPVFMIKSEEPGLIGAASLFC